MLKLSIVIPTYNGEVYLEKCLDSIVNQTVKPYEVIVVNDGSVDSTEKILEKYKRNYEFFNYITVANGGQGRARNKAMNMITGDYVMFVDSDDFLRLNTFERCEERIAREEPDVLMFDYNFFFEETGKITYPNKEPFLRKGYMDDEDEIKKTLLSVKTMFTVTRIYKTSFLRNNDIRYGEGYIYEDVEFWTHVSVACKRVSMIYAPLYIIRINRQSTTKSNHETDKHAKDFIKAVKASKVFLDEQDLSLKKKFSAYVATKFILYYKKRIPRKFKKSFYDDFLNVMGDYPIPPVKPHQIFIRVSRKLGVKNKILYRMYLLSKLAPKKPIDESLIKKLRKKKVSLNWQNYLDAEGVIKPVVLFTGFDNRYTGNSRYLFEEFIRNGFSYDFYFATNSDMVADEYRVEPYSERYYNLIYTAGIVIYESWIDRNFGKPQGKIWINLWHGTPYKKLLFDSEEIFICNANKKHKRSKFYNLDKIDYIFTDNEYVKKYFESSFLFDKDHLLAFGYPRVKYLIDNKDDTDLKQEIRAKYGIGNDEKIISYLPTWRDYNFKLPHEECDFSYLLDEEKLMKHMPEEYRFITKGHPFGNEIEVVEEMETQELLLVTDILITDYSSVMFDAFAIDIPVCLIEKDYELYNKARGVYPDMREDFMPYITDNEEELAKMILNYETKEESYKNIKEKYCYKSKSGDCVEFIEKLLGETVKNYDN